MVWFAIPIVIGLGGLVFGGCGDSSSSDEESKNDRDSPVVVDASSFQLSPPSVNGTLPRQLPNPVMTRLGPQEIEIVPSSPPPQDVERWAGQEGVRRRYLGVYDSLSLSSPDQKTAIKAVIDLIYVMHEKPGRPPFEVSYRETQDGPLKVLKVKDPIQVFMEVLLESKVDMGAKESLRREILTAIDEVRGEGKGKSTIPETVTPKPATSPARTPRLKGNGLTGQPI